MIVVKRDLRRPLIGSDTLGDWVARNYRKSILLATSLDRSSRKGHSSGSILLGGEGAS